MKNKIALFSLLLFISLFTLSCERNINNNEIKQNTEKDTVELPEELKAIMTKYRAEDKFIPKAPEDGSKIAKKLEKAQQQMDSLNRAQQTNPENVNTGTE